MRPTVAATLFWFSTKWQLTIVPTEYTKGTEEVKIFMFLFSLLFLCTLCVLCGDNLLIL